MANNPLFIFWNPRSLLPRLPDLKLYMSSTQPHLVGLCETWLKKKYIPYFRGYHMERADRPDRQGGGLAFLIKHGLPYVILPLQRYPGGGMEVLAVRINISSQWYSILICYNPNKDIESQEFLHYFHQLQPPVLIYGDFNAHHSYWEPSIPRTYYNKTGIALFQSLLQSANIMLLTPPDQITRIDPYRATTSTLDLCLGSGVFVSASITTGPYMGSDHFPIVVTVPLTLPSTHRSSRLRWHFGKMPDWTSFANALQLSHAPDSDIDLQVDTMSSDFLRVGKSLFRLTEGSFSSKPNVPWWDATCCSALASRKCL